MNNKGCGCIHKFICEKDLRTERLVLSRILCNAR